MYDYQPPLRDMQFILAELAGLDDIARTLAQEDGIAAYEAAHPARVSTTALSAG